MRVRSPGPTILLFNGYMQFGGGAEQSLLRFLDHTLCSVSVVELATGTLGPSLTAAIKRSSGRHRSVKRDEVLEDAWESRPDIVFSWGSSAHLDHGIAAAERLSIPVGWFQHSMPSPMRSSDTRAAAARADLVVCASAPVADAQRQMPTTAKSLLVASPGVSDKYFACSPRPRRDRVAMRLLTVARLEPWKRQLETVQAIAALDPAVVESFTMVGARQTHHPRYPEDVLTAAERLNLADRVIWVGEQDSLEEYYLTADAAVQASSPEPWGIAILEAMACGLPVICCEDAGVVQALGNPPGLVSFSPEDPLGLSRAISAVAGTTLSAYDVAELRGAARKYTWQAFAASLDNALARTAASAAPGAPQTAFKNPMEM